MVHALIDTLATVHYPAGLILAGLAATIVATPLTWKASK